MKKSIFSNKFKDLTMKMVACTVIAALLLAGIPIYRINAEENLVTNIAGNAAVYAEGASWWQGSDGVANLTDGDLNTMCPSESAYEAETEKEIRLVFNRTYTINEIRLYADATEGGYGFPENFKVDVYTGGKWMTVCSATGVTKADSPYTGKFEAVDTSVVRITATKLSAVNAERTLFGLWLGEIEIMGMESAADTYLENNAVNIAGDSAVYAEGASWWQGPEGVANLTDGDLSTMCPSESAYDAETTKEVELVFNRTYTINEIQLSADTAQGGYGFPENFKVDVYTGSEWVTVCSATGMTKADSPYTGKFGAMDVSAVRITATKLSAVNDDNTLYGLWLAEIVVKGVASGVKVKKPYIEEKAVNITYACNVYAEGASWWAGADAVASLTDGNPDTMCPSESTLISNSAKEIYLIFNGTFYINKVVLSAADYYGGYGFPEEIVIEAYTANGWQKVYTAGGIKNTASPYTCEFFPIEASAVCITATKLSASNEDATEFGLWLGEIEILGYTAETEVQAPVKEIGSDIYSISDGKITGIAAETPVKTFASKLSNDFAINMSTAYNNIGTGVNVSVCRNVLTIKDYVAVVDGDITGDGSVTAADILGVRKQLAGSGNLEGVYWQAADVDHDNSISVLDLVRTKKIAGANGTEHVTGKTYYVDSAAGNGNDGLTPETALNSIDDVNALELYPGDKVLFKRGSIWTGSLRISNSGTKENPIVYDAYGKGTGYPVINGEGLYEAAVYGVDVSWVEICNIEVTNRTSDVKIVRGIFINALNSNIEGIRIRGCYVHNVDADPTKISEKLFPWYDEHWNGGIVVRAGGSEGKTRNIKLNDVIIEGNRVEECSLTGITAGSLWDMYPRSTGVKILNNYVKECYGDGIIAYYCDGALIEENVSDNNGACDDKNAFYAGIWMVGTTNGIMQYNEAFGQGISGDGQGFDVDASCYNTLVQYNYSHDNYGGFSC